MRPSLGFHCSISIAYISVFQPFCCSGTFRKCLRCSWNPMQWSKCLYCYKQNCSCEFFPRQIRSVSAGPLAATRGIPIEKHWPTYLQALLILIILNLTFWCRWSSVPLYHVCTTCWEIPICPLTPWAKLFTSFLDSTLVP